MFLLKNLSCLLTHVILNFWIDVCFITRVSSYVPRLGNVLMLKPFRRFCLNFLRSGVAMGLPTRAHVSPDTLSG